MNMDPCVQEKQRSTQTDHHSGSDSRPLLPSNSLFQQGQKGAPWSRPLLACHPRPPTNIPCFLMKPEGQGPMQLPRVTDHKWMAMARLAFRSTSLKETEVQTKGLVKIMVHRQQSSH